MLVQLSVRPIPLIKKAQRLPYECTVFSLNISGLAFRSFLPFSSYIPLIRLNLNRSFIPGLGKSTVHRLNPGCGFISFSLKQAYLKT